MRPRITVREIGLQVPRSAGVTLRVSDEHVLGRRLLDLLMVIECADTQRADMSGHDRTRSELEERRIRCETAPGVGLEPTTYGLTVPLGTYASVSARMPA